MKNKYSYQLIELLETINNAQNQLDAIKNGLQTAIREIQQKDEVQVTMDAVADVLGVTTEQILGKGRKREIVDARTITTVVLYSRYNMSTIRGGRVVGIDHSTFLHHLKKANELIETDISFCLNLRHVMVALELTHITLKRKPLIEIPIQSLIKSL